MLFVANPETNRHSRNVMIMKYLVKLTSNAFSFAVARVFSRVDFSLAEVKNPRLWRGERQCSDGPKSL